MNFQIPYPIPLSTYRPFAINEMLPYLGGSAAVIQQARDELNIHPSQEVGSTYLVSETPTLAGVVVDETPARKDRTRLSCRASDFDGINQRFTSSSNTSAGKTALSGSVWFRVATNLTGDIFGEYETSGDERGWRAYLASGKPFIILSSDGTFDNSATKKIATVDSFGDNQWHHLAFAWSATSDELLIYVDGKQAATSATSDASIASIYDSSQTLQIGAYAAVGSSFFDGQLQQPLIYEGVWTPAEVRDLYLQQTDALITYGWFLDSDTAHPLTSASPTLTPANSPAMYEDDAIGGGDWLNEKGWNGAAEFNNVDTEIVFPSDISLAGDFEISVDLKGDGVNNFIGDDTSGLNFAYSNAATVVLRIANNTKVFNFGTSFNNTSFATVVITRTSGVTTITKDGETAPETLVASDTFTISRLGRERSNWFEGQIRNFKIVDAGATILDWPLVENSNDASGNGNDGTDSANVVYVAIPKRWDEELDSDGVAATDSNSFGVARRDGQLRGSNNAVQLDGINQYGTLLSEVSNYLDIGNAYTVSLQFEPNDTSSIQVLVSNGITASNRFSMQVHDDGTVRTAAYDGSFYSKSGGSVSVGVASQLVCSWDGSSTFRAWLDGVELTGANGPQTDQTGGLAIGRRPSVSANHFDGKLWDFRVYNSAISSLDDLDSLSAVNQIPMSEKTGDTSYDISGNGKDCTWQNSPERVDQDSYFWNENQGCSSVPVFVDSVQLRSGSVNYDGLKSSIFEFDFVLSTVSGGQVLYTNGGIAPVRVLTDGTSLNVNVKELADTTGTHTLKSDLAVGVLYQYKIEITEDATNPDTASTIVLSDRITGSVINTLSSLDVNLSLAISNSGNQILGVYTNFTTSFSGDLYRVRHVAGGVEELLWTADNYLVNQTDDSAMTETGGTLEIKKIPALAAGTNDANGYPLNQPAGPWLYEGDETYVDFDVVANANQWLEQRWIDASFNGTTSYLDTANNFNWANAFDVAMRITQANIGTGYLVGSVSSGAYSLQSNNLKNRAIINGSYDFTTAEFTENVEYLSEFSYTGGVGGTITVGIDGDNVSGVNDAISVSQNVEMRIGANNSLAFFSEISARSFAANNNGAEWVDMPLLGCSLDLSSQVNHGTDTDVVYNRLTDTSYTAGDVVEQPFSVTTSDGKVSDLVQFTFPVTTLSNTPTISQLVYEDGNTITEDSTLISEV